MDSEKSCSLLSDLQLIEALCSQEDDTLLYKEFVKRFHSDLNESCKQKCKSRKIDEHIGTDIAHHAFERVRQYKSFKRDKIKIADDRKAIKLYLVRITLNLFNNHYRKEKNESLPHKSYFDDIFESVSFGTSVEDLKKKKEFAGLVFKKLNPKEQKVILTDIEYKKNQKYLPDDVNETLSIYLGVKKGSVRKIRERALEKIQTAINEINQN